MATTANNGFRIPVSTDLVRNGATAIGWLGSDVDAILGPWTTYTPTIDTTTGWTKGTTGALLGRYQQVSNKVYFEIKFSVGNGTKGTSGIQFALPVANNTYIDSKWVNGVFWDDSASDLYPTQVRISGNFAKPFLANGTTLTQFAQGTPVTINTNDYWVINGEYTV